MSDAISTPLVVGHPDTPAACRPALVLLFPRAGRRRFGRAPHGQVRACILHPFPLRLFLRVRFLAFGSSHVPPPDPPCRRAFWKFYELFPAEAERYASGSRRGRPDKPGLESHQLTSSTPTHSLKSSLTSQQVKHLMLEQNNAEVETGSRAAANTTGSMRRRAGSQPSFAVQVHPFRPSSLAVALSRFHHGPLCRPDVLRPRFSA